MIQKHFKAVIQASRFGSNYAGKGKEFNDVDGNTVLDDDIASWRHVSNFDKTCDADCCAPDNPQSTCISSW